MNWPKYRLPSLLLCAKQGYWFCECCQKVAAIGEQSNVVCRNHCKTYAIKWHPPSV
jgi:hypothetical protein